MSVTISRQAASQHPPDPPPRNVATREKHLALCRELVIDHLTNRSILVEVGSADAPFDHLPGLAVGRKISLDVDISALETADRQRKIDGGSLLAADGHCMPLRSESVDGIIAIFVFEHLGRPTQFFEEAARVLKPGGFLFAVTPNVANPLFFPVLLIPVGLREKLLRIVGGHPDHRYLTHLKANTTRRLAELSLRSGFKISRCEFLWEDHYFHRLPGGTVILEAIDRWASGTELQGFAGRLYVLLQKNGPDGVPSRNENREPEDAEGQPAAGFLST